VWQDLSASSAWFFELVVPRTGSNAAGGAPFGRVHRGEHQDGHRLVMKLFLSPDNLAIGDGTTDQCANKQ